MIERQHITGLVLAGGQGTRMGGVDKGLQAFRGQPLALHALRRLQPQVGALMFSANRNLPAYQAFGAPVWPDEGGEGPLAGFLAGLAHCATPWLLTVPCDTPFFPADLAARLAAAAHGDNADIATAAAQGGDPQPVFCLLHARLRGDLADYLQGGGRKVRAWIARHRHTTARFDDDPGAFANANTLAELRALEPSSSP
ncbi:MAG: molybdenum cofactor guanylyltransferase MobA [Acidovorax sp.]|uniref:molybdenum cofactor guanylyltransferase MobA n=1 Tax=Acidovorax sp. TaxID=1872122 RepID=UPI0039E34762